jgi:hypothetical protein
MLQPVKITLQDLLLSTKSFKNIPAIQYNVIRNHHRIQGIGSRGVQAGWLLIGNNR